MLVRVGWEPDYVLDLPIDTFSEILLVAQKQQVQWQMTLGMTIMSAAAALFSKEASQKSMDSMQEAVAKIDTVLRGDDFDEEEEVYETRTTKKRRKSRGARTTEDGQRTVKQFHRQFQTFMSRFGIGVPDLDSAMKKRAAVLNSQAQAIDSQTKTN